MKQSAMPSHLPDHLVERFQFAKDWWHDDVTHFTAALYPQSTEDMSVAVC